MKKKFLLILAFYQRIIPKSWAFAADCPNIVGNWDFEIEWVFYDSIRGHGYETMNGILHITNQNDCLFYGDSEVPAEPERGCPITGMIGALKIIAITSCDSILKVNFFREIRQWSLSYRMQDKTMMIGLLRVMAQQ